MFTASGSVWLAITKSYGQGELGDVGGNLRTEWDVDCRLNLSLLPTRLCRAGSSVVVVPKIISGLTKMEGRKLLEYTISVMGHPIQFFPNYLADNRLIERLSAFRKCPK
jgi:hypothetical protein